VRNEVHLKRTVTVFNHVLVLYKISISLTKSLLINIHCMPVIFSTKFRIGRLWRFVLPLLGGLAIPPRAFYAWRLSWLNLFSAVTLLQVVHLAVWLF